MSLSVAVACLAPLCTVHSGSLKGPSGLCLGTASLFVCSDGVQFFEASLTMV